MFFLLSPRLLLIFALSLSVGLLRFSVPTRGFDTFSWPGTYEALAHLWLGVLIGAGLIGTPENLKTWQPMADAVEEMVFRIAAWVCLGLLTVLEVVMFLWG
jgi:hypothetical protein